MKPDFKTNYTHLNFGCGTNKLPAPWTNMDREVDITKGLPFATNSAERILAEHVVEHISGPQAFRFFKECFRILKIGGIFRICVPVLERLSIPAREDIICNHGHLIVFNEELLIDFLTTAGFEPQKMVVDQLNKEIDGHWRVIGEEKDERETYRLEVTK